MNTKLYFLFFAILFSVSLQAQSSIEIIDPPASVYADSKVDITFNYTLAVDGYAYIRFKNGPDTEHNITHISKLLSAGSGTETLSLEIPSSFEDVELPLGAGYNYQAQLFDHNNGWAGLATKDFNGVTLLAPLPKANDVTITSYPTTVNGNSSVDITFDYTTDKAEAYVAVRFKKNSNLTQVLKLVTAGSGTNTVSLPIPAEEANGTPLSLGSGYGYQIQLFDHKVPGGWNSAIVSKDYNNVATLEAPLPPANAITILNPPTTITGGRLIDFELEYRKDVATAHALIRFRGPNGNLNQAFKTVTDNEGTVTVSLLSPETGGTYSLQAQLFDHNGGGDWLELDTYDLSGITVNGYVPTGENTLEIVNTSIDPINNGSIKQVEVKYNLLQRSRILVDVRDKANAGSGKKIGEVWVDLPAGNDTVSLDLIVNNGFPGVSNRIQATLLKPDGSTEAISIPETPHIIVGKGDGTITYRGQPYSSGQNALFAEALGEGYYSNYYIASGWKGPLKMKFGSIGSPSWIEYENQNQISDGHKEFDIKIQKFSWHENKDFFTDRGYPTALKDINHELTGTLEGQWSAGSGGKGQINMTAWVTENGDMSGNRVDIIVHAFDNGGNFRKKYDYEQDRFRNLGEFTSTNGLTYQILRALPGYLGEVASYNLVPDAIVQTDPRADYTNDVITSTIDMKDIIENLIAKEAAYTGSQGKVAINENWQINGLEWTVVGQSGNYDTDNSIIPNGHGKFTFNSFTIPNLSSEPLSVNDVNSKFNNLIISPNPFSDSFKYSFNSDLSKAATVELFTIDGRKIKTINKPNSSENSGTVTTANLSKGVYIVRITSGNVQETRRLIKN